VVRTEPGEVYAVARYVRVPPQKARAVVNLVRGRPVEEALAILRFVPRRAAPLVRKVVESAAANAQENLGLSRRELIISRAWVDPGPILKRYHPRQRGQAFPILKRTAHITIVVRSREG
jgi:large subunit ribosomal protein L22